MGIPHDSPRPVKAGLQFALSEASEEGHCYLPEADLIAKAAELLGVDAALAEGCLDELAQEEGVELEVRLPRRPIRVGVATDLAERVLAPLVENGCRYGSGAVEIRVEREQRLYALTPQAQARFAELLGRS